MSDFDYYTPSAIRPTRRILLAVVLFTLAAALLAGALADGGLATGPAPLAEPAAPEHMPEWRGNSARLPIAE